jgi:hypothetical protein
MDVRSDAVAGLAASHSSQAVLVRALGTSWERGVRRISLVRLCLGPLAVSSA